LNRQYPSGPEFYRRLADYLEVPLEYLMFGQRRNSEWDRAILHLRNYVEDLIESKLRGVVDEHGSNGGKVLGQGAGLLS